MLSPRAGESACVLLVHSNRALPSSLSANIVAACACSCSAVTVWYDCAAHPVYEGTPPGFARHSSTVFQLLRVISVFPRRHRSEPVRYQQCWFYVSILCRPSSGDGDGDGDGRDLVPAAFRCFSASAASR